jgi:hypothetical protein
MFGPLGRYSSLADYKPRSFFSFCICLVLHNLYCSPSIIRMIKSRRIRWAGHVVQMREKRNAYRILVGKPE